MTTREAGALAETIWRECCPDGADADALRRYRERALEAARERFDPAAAGLPLSRFLCACCDRAVQSVAERVEAEALPHSPAAWLATGGYGRGLMSPGSSVRLVLLHDGSDPERADELAEKAGAALTAAGFRAACAAATADELIAHMQADSVQAAAMLAPRPVAGSRALARALLDAIGTRYLPGSWGALGDDLMHDLLARPDPFTGSPYCTEPNLKEGAGCLRDIGTVQQLDAALARLPELGEHLGGRPGLLDASDRRALKAALDFVLRVRNRLHMADAARSDVLYREMQDEVGSALGCDGPGGPGAALMRALFGHTGRVARVLRAADERFRHVYRVAWKPDVPAVPRDLGDGFVEVESRIYSALLPPFATPETAPRMMRLFRLSQRRHLPVSQQLLDEVARRAPRVGEPFRTSKEVGAAFLDLLAGSTGVAERIGWMRDCGLLQAYLPEVAPLVHRVRPEGDGDLTLDESAIEALRAIDNLAATKQPAELSQRQVLEQVDRPDLLRLAVLLHDVELAGGAAAEAAAAVAERIGLSRADRAELALLLSYRLALSELAERDAPGRDLGDLARVIGCAEALRMSYLLSYAHGRAVGSAGWFAWHEGRLLEVFQDAMAELVPGYVPFATAGHFDRELGALAAREGLAEEAGRLASLVPAPYKTQVSPDVALSHVRMLAGLRERPAAMNWQLSNQQATVWACTSDVPARFAQIVGVLTHNGLDILNAAAFTLADGTVLDRFVVRMKGRPINCDPTFWAQVEKDLVGSLEGRLDVSGAVRRRAQADRQAAGLASERLMTTVHVRNEANVPFTAVEITARDRLGLLFNISDALGALGLNIEYAAVATRGELAEDAFYVTEGRTGRRAAGQERLSAVRERLLEAIG